MISILMLLLSMNSSNWISSAGSATSGASSDSCKTALSTSFPVDDDTVVHIDHFRWLELDSPRRKQWILQQREKTKTYLSGLRSRRFWKEILTGIYDQERILKKKSLASGYEVALVDRGVEKPNEIILMKNGIELRVLFSTKSVDSEGRASLTDFELDPRMRRIIAPVAMDGSIDEFQAHMVDIETGSALEVLHHLVPSPVSWTGLEKFTYFKRLNGAVLKFEHQIGESQELDRLGSDIDTVNDPERRLLGKVTEDKTQIQYLSDGRDFTLTFSAESLFTTDRLLFASKKDDEGWTSLIRFSYGATPTGSLSLGIGVPVEGKRRGLFQHLFSSKKYSVALFRLGEKYWALILDQDGKNISEMDIPFSLSVTGISEGEKGELRFELASPILKEQKYDVNVELGSFVDPQVEAKMLTDEQGLRYRHQVISVESKDKTKIPVRITFREDLKWDGKNPAFVEGYGGFNVPGYFNSFFKPTIKQILKDGWIYVAPALRGGSELGPEWHQAGRLKNKQNVFDDMIATLEGIHSLKMSSPAKTAIMGWSNGGLLMGAMITQRPDLFAVAIPGNGVLDMAQKDRFDTRFDQGWSGEYGNWSDPDLARYLLSYSPVHRVEAKAYPNILIVTGLNDSRVNIVHSLKFGSALQRAQQGNGQIHLFLMKNSGHWVAKQDLQDWRAFETELAIWSTIYDSVGIFDR